MTDLSQVTWRKSSRSPSNANCVEVAVVWRTSSRSPSNNNCVEVATDQPCDAVLVRDSKQPDTGMLTFPADQWHAFTTALRAGAFDH